MKTQRLLRRERAGDEPGTAAAVDQAFHQLHVQLELYKHKVEGLEEALSTNKKKRKKKKVLPLQPTDPNLQGGAILWSPRSKARAEQELKATEQQQLEEEAAKTARREVQHQKKLLKVKEQEDKRAERLRLAEERAQQRAEERAQIDARKAARATQQRARDARKSIQLPKQAKHKASQQSQSKVTKRRGRFGARSRQVAHERSLHQAYI